jgi:hypothetical protein
MLFVRCKGGVPQSAGIDHCQGLRDQLAGLTRFVREFQMP